jgi:hypothetical protein
VYKRQIQAMPKLAESPRINVRKLIGKCSEISC